ncbi:MAG: SPOR domain-containing protein [Microscillaceae bacterium]|nr:SPOR domain-containing protein [Microscillaceae bacterium]MDW8459750.1 SPOR domain-containing protein [Cytophagales bacterium]
MQRNSIYYVIVKFFIYVLYSIHSNVWAQKASLEITEDFSIYNPKFTYQPEQYEGKERKVLRLPYEERTESLKTQLDITEKLHAFLDFVPVYKPPRIEKLQMQGYRIQIYRGKSLEEAKQARQRSYDLFPDITPYLEYKAPNYRVKVGDFLDQTEYIVVYNRLKREFPTALIVPALVNVVIEREKEKKEAKEAEKK